MGFFYRIFLKPHIRRRKCRPIPAFFPVFALCISFTSAGLETAISRTVARKQSLHQPREASETYFVSGLFISCLFSVITMIILQKTQPISRLRCSAIHVVDPILVSYALPLSYSWLYHGVLLWFKNRHRYLPVSQLIEEQTAGILSVFLPVPATQGYRNGPHAGHFHRSCGNCVRRTVFTTLFCAQRGLPQKSRYGYFPLGDFLSLL